MYFAWIWRSITNRGSRIARIIYEPQFESHQPEKNVLEKETKFPGKNKVFPFGFGCDYLFLLLN